MAKLQNWKQTATVNSTVNTCAISSLRDTTWQTSRTIGLLSKSRRSDAATAAGQRKAPGAFVCRSGYLNDDLLFLGLLETYHNAAEYLAALRRYVRRRQEGPIHGNSGDA
jgi:hypothetical protein